jgi:copper chaperone CopZ
MILTTIVPIAMELCCLWDQNPAPRPSFASMHLTPGRLRLRMPERRGDERFAQQVEAALARMPGVTQARANPVTGSVLVLFDPRQLDAPRIMAELASRGLVGRHLPRSVPLLGEAATRVGAAVGKELVKTALLGAVGEAWFSPLLALL